MNKSNVLTRLTLYISNVHRRKSFIGRAVLLRFPIGFSFVSILLLVLFFLLVELLLLLCQNNPIVLVIILVAALVEKLLEHASHGGVVGSFIESQVSACAQVLGEFNWVTLAQDLD